jgi:hypothetical protein
MNDHENRLRNLERSLRAAWRICLATAAVSVLIVGAAASQSSLIDIVCRSLQLKTPEGKTVIAMNDEGTVRIDGALLINGQDLVLKYKQFNVTIESPKIPDREARSRCRFLRRADQG